MKKWIWIVFVIVSLSSCHLWDMPWTDYDDPYFNNIPPLKLESVQEVMSWVSWNIDYVYDDSHYFQSPGQTYALMAGDCEDFTALAMYLLRQELGLNPTMINGYVNGTGHAWVQVNGEWWEPQQAQRCEVYVQYYLEIEEWSYAKTMWRAIEIKRSAM